MSTDTQTTATTDAATADPTELERLRQLSDYLDSATDVPGFWTVTDLADTLEKIGVGYSRPTIYRLLHAANVPLFKAGRTYLIEMRAAVTVIQYFHEKHMNRTHGGA